MASNKISYLAKANVALSVVLGVLIRWKLPRLADAIGACGQFAAMPLAAAAGVFSGAVQNIIGGLVATWWKRH